MRVTLPGVSSPPVTAPLDGRVALVTGASRGIGRGIAIGLGRAGASVAITGRTVRAGASSLPGGLEETAALVDAAGGTALPLPCDHGDDAAVARAFETIDARFGRLDVLVNNATMIPDVGILFSATPFWELGVSLWDALFAVGVRSHFVAAQHASPRMISAGGGLIINISSAGAAVHAGVVPYDVAKTAVDRLTVEMARELSPHGVPVVSLWPPPTATEGMLAAVTPDDDPRTWSPAEFTGDVVAALAADPEEARQRSGTAVMVRNLARDLGIADPAGPFLG